MGEASHIYFFQIRDEIPYPPGNDHISHQPGKGKSSSSKVPAGDRSQEGKFPWAIHPFCCGNSDLPPSESVLLFGLVIFVSWLFRILSESISANINSFHTGMQKNRVPTWPSHAISKSLPFKAKASF